MKGKSNDHKPSNDGGGRMWVLGKSEPGWYIARWHWNQAYADHLESLGYKVVNSVNKPDESEAA